MIYYRTNYREDVLQETIDHVRANISASCSATDDPTEFADQVEIELSMTELGFTRVYGKLVGHEPTGYELPEGYEEPSTNRQQQGFGERVMMPEELQEHIIRKEGLQL